MDTTVKPGPNHLCHMSLTGCVYRTPRHDVFILGWNSANWTSVCERWVWIRFKDLKINSTFTVSLSNPNLFSGDKDTWVRKQWAAWMCETISIWLLFSLIRSIIGKLVPTRTIAGGFRPSVQLVITRSRYGITHINKTCLDCETVDSAAQNKSEGNDVLVCYPPVGSTTECLTNQLAISKLQREDPVAERGCLSWRGATVQHTFTKISTKPSPSG